MNVNEVIAAVKANPPHEESPLPWRRKDGGIGEVLAADDSLVCEMAVDEDAAHIAAAVNAAPVLIAEVERLLPHAGEIAALADLHILCADAGIAPGHIVERVRSLTTALEAARVAVEEIPRTSHDLGCRRTSWERVGCDCDTPAAIDKARRALGLEVGEWMNAG